MQIQSWLANVWRKVETSETVRVRHFWFQMLCLVWPYSISAHIPKPKRRSLSPQTLTQICFSKASKQGPLLNHNRHLAAHSLFIVSINIKKLCLYSLLIRYPIISSDYDNSLAKNYRMSTFAIHTCQKWCTSNTLLKCKGIKSGLVFSCSHSLLINFWLNLWFCSGSVPLLTRVCPSLLQITVRLLLLITLLVQTQYDGLLD